MAAKPPEEGANQNARILSLELARAEVSPTSIGNARPGRPHRLVRYCAAMVRLCCPACDRARATGLDDRHDCAARRQVDGEARDSSRPGRHRYNFRPACPYSDPCLVALGAAHLLAGKGNLCRRAPAREVGKLQPAADTPSGAAEGFERHWLRHPRRLEGRAADLFDCDDHPRGDDAAISGFVIFVFSLIFYLIYRPRLRNAMVMLVSDRDSRLTVLHTLNEIDDNMTTYFGTFTLINIGLGIAASALTWVIGLPNPLLWGVLATLLNYVPYLGPAVVIGTLAIVGLLLYPTLEEAAVAPLFYLGLVTVEGQFITPTLMGRRLEINPFAILLAIAFCTWFWGPVGALLAVPLLMALSVALQNSFEEEKPDLPN